MRTKNISDEAIIAIVFIAVWVLIIGVSVWWLPQKWQGCTKLYDSRPAQIFCFLQG